MIEAEVAASSRAHAIAFRIVAQYIEAHPELDPITTNALEKIAERHFTMRKPAQNGSARKLARLDRGGDS